MDCYEEGCTRQANWRACYEECVITRRSAGVIGDDEDQFFTTYYCFGCMAVRWGCAEGDALVRIRDGRRDVKRRREQNAAFNAATAKVVAAVPGVSKSERRELAIDLIKEVMSPLVRFVRIKTKMLKQRSLLLGEHSALIVRMRDAQQLRDVLDLIPRLDAIEQEVGNASEPIAFKGRGSDQWAFCLAADYADEWTVVRGADGSIQCAFRSYHSCKSKAGEKDGCCGTAIASKAWSRKLSVPWASGQTWYCNCCGAG